MSVNFPETKEKVFRNLLQMFGIPRNERKESNKTKVAISSRSLEIHEMEGTPTVHASQQPTDTHQSFAFDRFRNKKSELELNPARSVSFTRSVIGCKKK